MNRIRKTILDAIASRQNILVAGQTGSGKHAVLASIVKESDPDYPRFVFSGEPMARHLDGTPSKAIHGPALLLAIVEAGLPIAAEVQAKTEVEAHERFASASGLSVAQVRAMFPVVVLVDFVTAHDYLTESPFAQA